MEAGIAYIESIELLEFGQHHWSSFINWDFVVVAFSSLFVRAVFQGDTDPAEEAAHSQKSILTKL